jgi:hypothetical protein
VPCRPNEGTGFPLPFQLSAFQLFSFCSKPLPTLKNSTLSTRTWCVFTAAAFVFAANFASAATERFWSGGGGSDNISDSGNWYNGTPNVNDPLTFNNTPSGNRTFTYFNYGDYYQFGAINIYNAAGAGEFYGNALKFTDYIKNNDNSNQWKVYNGNVSAAVSTGSSVYVIADGGGFYFKLDNATAGGGNGDTGHFYLDTLTLDVQGTGPTTFQCIIANGNGTGNLYDENSNTVTLSGSTANAYTGTTTVAAGAGTLLLNKTAGVAAISGSSLTVNGGTVKWGANNQISDSTTVTLNGGTLNTAGLSEGTHAAAGVGALTLQANSFIDLGSGASILHFADSSGIAWTSGKILQIDNWSGLTAGSGTDQLLFGTTSGGLTGSQIAEIQFLNPAGFTAGTYGAAILSSGEVVPIPEPGTWAVGILAAIGLLGASRRRLAPLSRRRTAKAENLTLKT